MNNLNNQNRITRLCLIGKGIVCGLDIYTDEDFGIYIGSGNGVSSRGIFMEVSNSDWYRYYKPFDNPDNYSFFNDVEVWEILQNSDEDTLPLKPQNSEEELNLFLTDKVALIYKEKNTGNIRFLLMNKGDMLQQLNLESLTSRLLWERIDDDDDYIYTDNYNPNDTQVNVHDLNKAMNPAIRLPEIPLPRLGYYTNDPFYCPEDDEDPFEFTSNIDSLNDLYDAYEPIIDFATKELDQALTQLHTEFGALFDLNKHAKVTEWIALLCEKWEAFKNENGTDNPENKRYYIQYFYGWVRDLIQAYHELRLKLIDYVGECCSHENDFPRHLILGIVLRNDLARQPKPLRHVFVQPPIYNGNADRLQCIRLYCWRILMMIKEFYLPGYINDPDMNPYCPTEDEPEESDFPNFSPIKITPSCCYDELLEKQSIPFYYPLSQSRYSVHNFWNYHRTKTCSQDRLLSYHAINTEDSYTEHKPVIYPLLYNLKCNPFFRVEGHIGKLVKGFTRTINNDDNIEVYAPGAEEYINYWIQKYNLPIQVRVVFVSDSVTVTNLELEYSLTQGYEFPDLSNNDIVIADANLPDEFTSFRRDLLGIEHLAGAKSCGTLILVAEPPKDENGNILSPTGSENLFFDNESSQIVNGVVIADFFLPKCGTNNASLRSVLEVVDQTNSSEEIAIPQPVVDLELEKVNPSTGTAVVVEKTEEELSKTLLDKIGTATIAEKDDLTVLKGLGKKTEESLNSINIFTLKQLSQLEQEDYAVLDQLANTKGKALKNDWSTLAKGLIKNK